MIIITSGCHFLFRNLKIWPAKRFPFLQGYFHFSPHQFHTALLRTDRVAQIKPLIKNAFSAIKHKMHLQNDLIGLNDGLFRYGSLCEERYTDVRASLIPVKTTGLFFALIFRFDPQMFADLTSLLREEVIEVGRLSLAARPVLHTFVEDWTTWVILTRCFICFRTIVGRFAGFMVAVRTNSNLFWIIFYWWNTWIFFLQFLKSSF